jgi:CPA2 family monovalent cation:H+ antiporter-2
MGAALLALGAALLVAGIFARVGRRYGLPTIPLFMLAGFLFGPNTPGLDLVHDPGDLRLVATLGLVLLLFSLGLEFTMADLADGGRKLLAVGAVYLALNVGVGVAFGFLLGWGDREALVIAGIVGISSSAIVTKLVVELRRIANPETRLILGVVVVEDIFLALYLAVLQPVLDDTQGLHDIVVSIVTAFTFLIVLAVVARKGARLVGKLVDTDDNELLVVCFVGFAVLVAGVAEELGVSDAIGAFMAGLILAETRHRQRIEELVLPLRDTFAAMFFFAFGVTIDPGAVVSVAGPVAIAVVLTVVLNVTAGAIAARTYGLGRTAAANIGLTVLARGEFALILASYAAAAGLDERIAPFVAGYVLILALGAPIAAKYAPWLATRVGRDRSSGPPARGGAPLPRP